jgi:hypothetical protein
VDLNDASVLAQDGLIPSESNPQFHQQIGLCSGDDDYTKLRKGTGSKGVVVLVSPWGREKVPPATAHLPSVFFNNLTRLLVTPQTHELRVPQVIAFGPFRKLDLCYQFWAEPFNLLHHVCCDRFATPGACRFGKICERTY